MGFGVWGLGFGVSGFGGSGLRVMWLGGEGFLWITGGRDLWFGGSIAKSFFLGALLNLVRRLINSDSNKRDTGRDEKGLHNR